MPTCLALAPRSKNTEGVQQRTCQLIFSLCRNQRNKSGKVKPAWTHQVRRHRKALREELVHNYLMTLFQTAETPMTAAQVCNPLA